MNHKISLKKIIDGLKLILEGLDYVEVKPVKTTPDVTKLSSSKKIPKTYMSLKEIQESLDVHRGVVYKYIRAGLLPGFSVKCGRSSYWNRKETREAINKLKRRNKNGSGKKGKTS